jgi:hypothetical protein
MHAVIETPAYLRAAEKAGMTDEERESAVSTIAGNPLAGDEIRGPEAVGRYASPGAAKERAAATV